MVARCAKEWKLLSKNGAAHHGCGFEERKLDTPLRFTINFEVGFRRLTYSQY